MVGVAYIKGYILPPISDWGVWHETTLEVVVTMTPLLRSMEGTCHEQVCVVVLGAHLVLSVLAALVACIGYMYLLWCLERTWYCLCLLYWAYVLAICGALSAPMCWLCVLWGAWRTPGARGKWP